MTQYNSHGIFLIQHFKLNKRYNPDLMFIHPSMLCSSLTWREHCYISPPSLRTQQDALFFLNMAWTLLYIATKFENTKRPIMKFDNILSFFLTKPWWSLIQIQKNKKVGKEIIGPNMFSVNFSNKKATYASVMAAGKIKTEANCSLDSGEIKSVQNVWDGSCAQKYDTN